MKKTIILFLLLALVLAGCAQEAPPEPYTQVVNGVEYRVDPQNQIITANGWDFPYTVTDECTSVRYPNGATFNEHRSGDDSAGTLSGCSWGNGDFDTISSDGAEYANCYDLISVVPEPAEPEEGFNFLLFLQGLLCIALGITAALRPEIFWLQRYGWWIKDAEPSDRGLGIIIAGGYFAVIGGIIFMLAAFV